VHATLGQRPGHIVAAPTERAWQPHFGLCLLLAWLVVAAQLLVQDWALTGTSMHDADDALRLVQLRSFIAGQGWFDLHLARLGPPAGYDSHWSRLIDAGLAGLFFIFNAFVEHDLAERLMTAVWPLLWLVPTIGGAAAIAWRLAGREAALILLVLAIFGMPAMGQFRPGRIDHHNVQIALAMLVVAATLWSDRRRWAAHAAGAVTGLALAIGLESLNVLALCGIGFVLRFIIDGTAAPALRAYGVSLAAMTAGAFLVTVAPAHWGQSVCDALAINTAAGVIVGATGVVLAAVGFGQAGLAARCAVIATVAAITAAVYIALEPRCLAGPYAMVDPAIFPIWFDHVAENQSLAAVFRRGPVSGVALVSFPLVVLIGLAILAARPDQRRDFGFLAAAAIFLGTAGVMIVAAKVGSYVLWLGMPLVAAAAVRLYERLRLSGLALRFFATMLITPTAVSLGAMEAAAAAGMHGLLGVNEPPRQACIRHDSYATLAHLHPGLVVPNELEWGSFILAWTPHSALAGPYHRMGRDILAWHGIFAGAPEAARRILDAAGADYIALCGSLDLGPTEAPAGSLLTRLQAGDIPEWLELLPEFRGQPFTVYRIRR
jgi:hypothetical protein